MILFACIWACAGQIAIADPEVEKLPTAEISIKGHSVLVELADEPHERSRGLMYRRKMSAGEGMLFVYPEAKPRSFWMKNTYLPLSIAFISDNGMIINISQMTPQSLDSVPSSGPAQFALEVPQGWFKEHGITAGQAVDGLPKQ